MGDEYSRDEVALKAGVTPAYVDRLVEYGLLPGGGDSFSSGDVRTACWIRGLDEAGVPLEGIAAAVSDGRLSFSFLEVSAFDRFAAFTDITFQQLSDTTGLPFDLLSVIREAVGHADPKPDDYVRADELEVAEAVRLQVSHGFHRSAIERWLRLYADSLGRIAETEEDWYRTQVVDPLLDRGMSEAEMLDAQAVFGSQMAPLLERALLAIYHGQQERFWKKGALEPSKLPWSRPA